MKITEVRSIQPPTPSAPKDWRTIMGQILVAVETDCGLIGYGVGGGGPSSVHLINQLLRDLLIGRDPSEIEAIWQLMYRATLPFGHKGIAIMAISGIDLALWDLKGKAEKRSIARLLSDIPHQTVPCYASLGTEPQAAVDQGYRAVKLHLPAASNDEEKQTVLSMVDNARQIIGKDARLMTDAFMRWDVPTTLELAHQFQSFNVEWVEEPLLPDDVEGYAQLERESPLPIAGGEHEFTATGFEILAKQRLHTILQPDVTWCGGMTQLVKIYQIAQHAGLRVCQHRGAELWGLHAVAALETNDSLAEQGRSWMDWVHGQPEIKDGRIEVPDEPGFGVHIDPALF